jgi:RNA polymerase sigma-70 factor (ECF subfamily)
VAGLIRRESRAFTAVYERHRVPIYSFLVRLCGHRDVADDLFQETFLQLARHAPRLRPDTELAAWLYTVARNRYRSYRRTALWRRLRLLALGPGGGAAQGTGPAAPSTPLEHALHGDLSRQLERALQTLPTPQREVLLLVGVQGVEQEAAAAILGLSSAALRQRLARARAQVQEYLSKTTKTTGASAGRPAGGLPRDDHGTRSST